LTGERADLLHDRLEKALGDLPGRKARYLGIDHGLYELARWNTDACFGNDFGGVLEDDIGLLVEGDGNCGGLAPGLQAGLTAEDFGAVMSRNRSATME
jgi:hypothetical protein